MILQVVEEIQKIPLANKAAYRRFFLQVRVSSINHLLPYSFYHLLTFFQLFQKMMNIKETKDEFEQYLVESVGKAQEENDGDQNEDDEDEDDEAFPDRSYSVGEIPLVEKCVRLFQQILDCLKLSLRHFTELADLIQDKGTEEQQLVCQRWIAMIERQIEDIENQVTDLGALLYPPIDSEDPEIQENYQKLIRLMQEFIQFLLLSSPDLGPLELFFRENTSESQQGIIDSFTGFQSTLQSSSWRD